MFPLVYIAMSRCATASQGEQEKERGEEGEEREEGEDGDRPCIYSMSR